MFELEGFELLERLGSGGMSTVWKARQCSLDREVAIKVLSPSFASTEEDVKRFMTEARTAGKLKHPGVVQVYDAVFKDGVYCFVMELVDGYTVGDWVRRKGRLEESHALDIADCVAEALDYAWQQFGMVHCDIKPDNVMVDSDGTVKLTDLGLSRTVSALRSGTAQQEGDVFGTPAYIAPEQAMGEPQLDCRADMYSLGAMLYHLVTGRMLFESEPQEKVMELQVSGYAPALRTLVPEVSVPFENLVEKLLAKERRHRHSDWEKVRRDIRAVRLRRPLPSGLPHPKASTMLPDPSRAATIPKPARNLRSGPAQKRGGGQIWKPFAVGLAIALLLALAWRQSRPAAPAGPPPVSRKTAHRAATLLDQAERWAQANPGWHDAIAGRFQQVVDLAPNSQEAERARAVITLCQERIAAQQAAVLEGLSQQAAALEAAAKIDDAIALYRDYSGPQAAATREARLRRIEELRARSESALRQQAQRDEAARREAAAQAQRARAETFAAELLRTLFDEGVMAAQRLADAKALESPDLLADSALSPLRTLITGAVEAEQTLLQSFTESIGKEIELQMRSGRIAGRLISVSRSTGDLFLSRLQGGTRVQFSVNVRDLALQDRLARMGTRETPGLRLARALHAVEQGAYDYARMQARTLPPAVQQRLLEKTPPGR